MYDMIPEEEKRERATTEKKKERKKKSFSFRPCLKTFLVFI